MMTFYIPGKTHLLSIATLQDGEYRCAYYKRTLAELRAETGEDVQLLPLEDAGRMIDDAQTRAYCRAPVEITREQFDEMMNVLPPAKWLRGTASEAFFVPEALCADIYSWHVRIGEQYWCLNRSGTRKPESIIAEVATAAGVTL